MAAASPSNADAVIATVASYRGPEQVPKPASLPQKSGFAPVRLPRYRRLQTMAVMFWTALLPCAVALFLILMSFPFLWPILIPYLVWVLFIDQAAERGGRRVKAVREWNLWWYFASYFPASLVKTAELPSDRRYVFGYHPHGIIGMGALTNFATEATGFSKTFPGLTPHLLTLKSNFQIPFYRDYILAMGIASVSMKSCQSILRKGPGNCITIVVGGAAESLSAHPGTADLTLKRRYGFIKLAIREGADLVPVFSFGENDIYEQLSNDKGTTLYKIQKRFQSVFGFTLPIFHGRGIFNYSLGLLPYRHPIVSVVGRPISTIQSKNPTDEEVERIQKLYITELTRIWDEYKEIYAPHRTKEMTLIA